MSYFDAMFSEFKLGNKTVKNRIALSPMGDNKADYNGGITEGYMAYYERIAQGGAGIIVPGVLCVDWPAGKATNNTLRMDNILCAYEYSQFADRIHRHGALLIPQIHHAGPQTAAFTTGCAPKTPSDVTPGHAPHATYRSFGPQEELTVEEIKVLIQKYIQTAVYCKIANCDGISLHASHGYLISSFLSPDINKRTDEYGGSFENRVRFAVEIVSGIRAACGPDFIIGARIPGMESTPDGLSQEECIRVAQVLEEAGCDWFDISKGSIKDANELIETPRFEQGNRVPYAAAIKKAVKRAKVSAVGVLRDPEYCESLIRDGVVDIVTLGRALLVDPDWPIKARAGKVETIRPCLSCCDGCLGDLERGGSIHCAMNPETGRETVAAMVRNAETPKKVLVVGGGIAGMQAAIIAARRGHIVTLAETSSELGGQMNLACIPPNKQRIGKARDWFVGETVRQEVDVKLNTKVDKAFVDSLAPDEIIIAAGVTPATPPIPGVEYTVQAWDALRDHENLPEKKDIVIIGGGTVGCETAELLAEKKNRVTVLEMLPSIANGLEASNLTDLLAAFASYGVNVVTEAVVKEISADSVTYENKGCKLTAKADMIILSAGRKPVGTDLAQELKAAGYSVHTIGDANVPGKFMTATTDAFFLASRI